VDINFVRAHVQHVHVGWHMLLEALLHPFPQQTVSQLVRSARHDTEVPPSLDMVGATL
jgi:hypothetical protein